MHAEYKVILLTNIILSYLCRNYYCYSLVCCTFNKLILKKQRRHLKK